MIRFLIDANVISELTKPHPRSVIIDWLDKYHQEWAIDAIVRSEIRYGIELMPTGRKRKRLEEWYKQGIQSIPCLAWDAETGETWARLRATLRLAGKTMPLIDSMIAATVIRHRITLVSQNVKDFAAARIPTLDLSLGS